MTTEQPVPKTQQLRVETGCLLDATYPEFSHLAAAVPDALLRQFFDCMHLSPSGVFLEYCERAYRRGEKHWGIALSNLFRALPDITDETDARLRSGRVSLTVTVIAEMELNAWGTMHEKPWDDGRAAWVRAAVLLALALPSLWHEAGGRNRMMVYMALGGRNIRINGLVSLCRERGFIDGDLVRAYLENNAAPLRVGVL
jgi:hypothetical protein